MGKKEREREILPTGVWWGNVASVSIIFLVSAVFPQNYWRRRYFAYKNEGLKLEIQTVILHVSTTSKSLDT